LAKPTIFFGTDLGRCNSEQKTCEQVLAVKGLVFFSSVAKRDTTLSSFSFFFCFFETTKQNKTVEPKKKKKKFLKTKTNQLIIHQIVLLLGKRLIGS